MRTTPRDAPMAYGVDDSGDNPQVNYEPSVVAGLEDSDRPMHDEQGPEIRGRLTRKPIARSNDHRQAGERYLLSEERERLANLGNNGPRDVSGHVMTHCVPDERDVRVQDEAPVGA